MKTLKDIEPEEVYRYFEDISAIPHGSGNVKAISDYCVAFAKEHGLRCRQDASYNIIIWKPGTAGYEKSSPVILQGHLDMVTVKEETCDKDLEKDGLTLKAENGYLSAEGTSLGADDGIAVAYSLAVLASTTIAHPPLEVVFTVNEEIGLLGAAAIDVADLKGRILLNMDSEDEGVFLAGCAGGATVTCTVPAAVEEQTGICVQVEIRDLTGGHSGAEIIWERANANQLFSRILLAVSQEGVPAQLQSVCGGEKDNAIPRTALAVFRLPSSAQSAMEHVLDKCRQTFTAEFAVTDPDLKLNWTFSSQSETGRAMTADAQRAVAVWMNLLPYGIQKKNPEDRTMVQTSLNPGVLSMKYAGEKAEISLCYSVRSSIDSEKDYLIAKMKGLTELLQGTTAVTGAYPAWEFQTESRIREIALKEYEKISGKPAQVQVIHAGVECGLLGNKLPGLDSISFGPQMYDIHTFHERLDLDSAARYWKLLKAILADLK